ncbi:MAG: metallophosphoesterase, partial [Planctomycetaceae bacterium]|nr:metallophosphoesterase [Planctomycetaceae bacterium]
MPESITILHVSDMQFGKNHRFQADTTLGDNPFDTLLKRMCMDLDQLRDSHRLRPDLIICTGDLAEWGLPEEFRQAFDFLDRLARHLELSRDRVVVIPGNHDINRDECEAYFLQCKPRRQSPQAPWFPKWNFYAEAFTRFYSGVPGVAFTPDVPYSLFPIRALSVVVAGLNSTMREGHEGAVTALNPPGHYGWCGEPQLRWFDEQLGQPDFRGWLKIGAVHHNFERGCLSDEENLKDADDLKRILGRTLHLLLHGHTHQASTGWLPNRMPVYATGSAALLEQQRPDHIPNQYQLLQITRTEVTRATRAYYPDRRCWGADPRGSHDANQWITVDPGINSPEVDACFPISARGFNEHDRTVEAVPRETHRGQERDFLDQVAEAARIRFPESAVELVRNVQRELWYLRVSCVESGIVRQFPVGTHSTGCPADYLQRYCDEVVAQYRANDPGLQPEFVYGGRDAAPEESRIVAQRLRLRLCSFIEFQGLIDLRTYVDQQSKRLAADPIYPPALYVPQRLHYEIGLDRHASDDALRDVAQWLSSTESCFTLILGEFGTGKTFLLNQLARRLGELPGINPVLIELRALDKANEIDQLLAQHFALKQFRIIDLDKLRYMIREGRIVLLFDGFDELALRVGFARAADHLDTLIQAADKNARMVVTSRTSHFENDKQVRNKLGDHVKRIGAGLRYCRLQKFDEGQVRQYLKNRFPQADEAEVWFDLIKNVRDLLGLSEIPRMLSFIVALDRKKLEEARAGGGSVAAADLYRMLIVEHWLEHEYRRVNMRGAAEGLSRKQLLGAVRHMALKLWEKTDRWISLSELAAETECLLKQVAPEKLAYQEATSHEIASGTLLVRDDDGRFTFVHQSIMEWLVADAAAEDLRASREPTVLGTAEISRLMADFLVTLGGELTGDWAANTPRIRNENVTGVQLKNAITISVRQGRDLQISNAKGQLVLRGTEQRGEDLSGLDLREADLSRCDLREAVFGWGQDLSGAK